MDVSGVDVSMDGIELQDREFVAAIREGREPNASIAQVMPCYRTLEPLEPTAAPVRTPAGRPDAGQCRSGCFDQRGLPQGDGQRLAQGPDGIGADAFRQDIFDDSEAQLDASYP
ncbi:hypothetical protein AB0O22_18385 [Streptomyces sp. NPDC091204]|uniref:hypothetical protein n=1 Tax=Streptomyces sp. NPDC091204 TaxID=3155299 RepID=UPI0034414109